MRAETTGTMIGARGLCVRAGLILGILLFLGASLVVPQPAAESGKDKDKAPVKPSETKGDPKTGEPAKSTGKETPAPTYILSEKQYQEFLELKKKLSRQVSSSCKLTGDLKDNAVVLEAEFGFKTELPNMVVFLGLHGGFLFDPKRDDLQKLAEQGLALKDDEDGVLLEVAKPGEYRVPLHLKVPVGLRRFGEAGGGERGIKLGLPGSLFTELSLAMPDNIKEIRWKDKDAKKDDKDRKEEKFVLEKKGQDGRWHILLGANKTLDLVWKEPVVLPGTGPLLVVKNNITVKLEEANSVIVAEMLMEDLRGQSTEWQLFLPYRAEVKVKPPPGVVPPEIVSPPLESKGQAHIIRFKEATSQPFTIRVEARTSRKGTNSLLVGPFLVPNAYSQQGTITVQATPAALRGQWLDYQPSEGTSRKSASGQDVKAVFDFWNLPGQPKGGGKVVPSPLQIFWRGDKAAAETSVDHLLRVKRLGSKGLQVDLTTQIKIKSLSQEFLDLQLPVVPVPKMGLLAFFPMASFPAGIPWAGFVEQFPQENPLAEPTETFTLEEEAGVSPPAKLVLLDTNGKAQIRNIPVNKEISLILTGKYVVPNFVAADVQHFRIELPRPLGIVDRGGKMPVVIADDQIELPKDWDPSLPYLELTWRPYQPQFLVQNVADVAMRGKEAHVRQQLALSSSPSAGKELLPRTGTVSLPVPRNARNVKVSGGERIAHADPDLLKVKLAVNEPLVVEFYQPLPEGPDNPWKVPLIVPEGATSLEAKVRIWADPGIQPEAIDVGDRWQDRGVEYVPGKDLPVLVLHGSGKTLDLTLRLPAARPSQLPALVCDKGLIQVRVGEEGEHVYRAHYLIQKLYVNPLDVLFPAPADACIIKITLNGVDVPWSRDKDDRNLAHIKLDPKSVRSLAQSRGAGDGLLLLIEYKLSANFAERDSSWQTQLCGPIFQGDVILGSVRWLVSLPPSWVSVPTANNVLPDFRWSLQSWLLAPEAVVSAGELTAWQVKQDEPLSLVLSRGRSQDSITVIHFPRQTWLLICSGLLLAVGLALHMLPLARSIFWFLVVSLGLGLIVGGFLWPAWVPALLFGAQPGALVLGLILGIHWVLNERYRRQVIFMPGFTRLKPGSSLLQNPPAPRPREASTVDAPAPSGVQGRGIAAPLQPPS